MSKVQVEDELFNFPCSGVHASAPDGRQEEDPGDRERRVQGYSGVVARDRRNCAHEGDLPTNKRFSQLYCFNQ